jgi:hypothetical protein
MKRAPGADENHFIHWSYVGAGVPWKHTPWWQPAPTEPDRIAALEKRVEELRRGEDAVELIFSHLQSRLEALEGVQADGTVPAKVPGGIAALDQRLATLEALTARLSLSTAAALESLRAQP